MACALVPDWRAAAQRGVKVRPLVWQEASKRQPALRCGGILPARLTCCCPSDCNKLCSQSSPPQPQSPHPSSSTSLCAPSLSFSDCSPVKENYNDRWRLCLACSLIALKLSPTIHRLVVGPIDHFPASQFFTAPTPTLPPYSPARCSNSIDRSCFHKQSPHGCHRSGKLRSTSVNSQHKDTFQHRPVPRNKPCPRVAKAQNNTFRDCAPSKKLFQ